MRGMLCVIAITIGASSTPAADLTSTVPGFTYFNRSGADLRTLAGDLRACHQLADQLHQPFPSGRMTWAATGMAAAVGGATGDLVVSSAAQLIADGKARPVNVENCMVVKGWRVVALDDAEGHRVAIMDAKAKAAQFNAWTGLEPPHGTIVRVFSNDAASEDTSHIFSPAGPHETALNDTLAIRNGPASDATGLPAATPSSPTSDVALPEKSWSARPPKPLKELALNRVPDGLGLIVVTLPADSWNSVGLERMGLAGMPAPADSKPTQIIARRPRPSHKASAPSAVGTFVFAAPPGRWRIASMVMNGVSLSLCLGGPALDLKAGDAVYFTLFDASGLTPVDDLASAKAAFPNQSTVPERLRSPAWINGAQGPCEGAYLYALELPDRPFLSSYVLGSRALAARGRDTGSMAQPAALH